MPGNETLKRNTHTLNYVSVKSPYFLQNLLRVLLRNRNWTKTTERLVGFAQFPVATKKAKKPDMFCEPCPWFWVFFEFLISFNTFFCGMVYLLVQNIGGWPEELKWWFIKSTFEAANRGYHTAVQNGTRAVKPYNLGVWVLSWFFLRILGCWGWWVGKMVLWGFLVTMLGHHCLQSRMII